MNLKEMEEAYKTGDWIALSKLKGSTKKDAGNCWLKQQGITV